MVEVRRGAEEAGAAATALLVTGALVGLAIFIYMGVPLGSAVDAKARNRTAADAAALAGAEAARSALVPGLLQAAATGSTTGGGGHAGLGREAAEEYAGRNGGVLVSYFFDVSDGTAHAAVEGDAVEGHVARSEAVAQVDLPRCDWPAVPPPPPPSPTATPSEEPDDAAGPGPGPEQPEPDPEPPPPVEMDVECSGVRLGFTLRFDDDGNARFEAHPGSDARLAEALPVRLVG